MDAGTSYRTEEPIRANAIDQIDQELERLAHTIDLLSSRLRPVSTSSAEVEQMRPNEDSRSPLEGRAIRLGELTGIIDRLIRDLDI